MAFPRCALPPRLNVPEQIHFLFTSTFDFGSQADAREGWFNLLEHTRQDHRFNGRI